jgi:AraC-like DNA-binding protein
MTNTNLDQFHYCYVPEATSKEIANVYGESQFRVREHPGQNQTLLRELRHLRWHGFELLSATHVIETRVSMRQSNDVIAFLLPSDGQVEISLKSRQTLRTNGAVAFPRLHCREMRLAAGKRQIHLGISSRRLHRHIKSIHGQAFKTPIDFEQTPKLDAGMLDCIVGLIDAVFQNVEAALFTPALLANRIEALEICLLAVWPNSLWHNFTDRAASVSPRHVRSTIGEIHADPFAQFSISSLARNCNVSVRTLQNGFRQFTSLSISEFVTHSRLSTIEERAGDQKFIEAVRNRIGASAFKRLNLEYRIRYGRNIGDR